MYEEPSSKKFNATPLPSSEVSRRHDAIKIRAYARLIINVIFLSLNFHRANMYLDQRKRF